MIDVMDANEFCNVCNGLIRTFEKFFGLGNTQIDQIFMGRGPDVPLELLCHVIFANTKLLCQIIETDGGCQVLLHIVCALPDIRRD